MVNRFRTDDTPWSVRCAFVATIRVRFSAEISVAVARVGADSSAQTVIARARDCFSDGANDNFLVLELWLDHTGTRLLLPALCEWRYEECDGPQASSFVQFVYTCTHVPLCPCHVHFIPRMLLMDGWKTHIAHIYSFFLLIMHTSCKLDSSNKQVFCNSGFCCVFMKWAGWDS